MSGFEIAGVVLGAIPLVLAAVEQYESVTSPMKVFLRFNGEVSKVIRELGNLQVSYELSLRVVLQPIVDDQDLTDMMEDPRSGLWSDAEVDSSLRKSLGDAYAAYRRTTEDIEGVILEILSSLNIEDFWKSSGDGLQEALLRFTKDGRTSKFQIQERLKYGKSRKRIKTRLDDIRSYITLLDSYEAKATKLAARELTTASARFKFALPLKVLQSNAAKLYDVLSKSWCSAHSSHAAGLLLESRIVAGKKRCQAESCDTGRFNTPFLQTPVVGKRWVDVEFRLVEDCSSTVQQKSQVKVKITGVDSNNVLRTPLPYEDPAQLQIVKDICRALQRYCYPSIGFCFDHTGYLRGAYEAQRPKPVKFIDDSLNLHDLMQHPKYKLSLKEKYTLSITLASTLLQLSPTPWLRESWNKSDIVFLRANDTQISCIPVDISHPYLTHEHIPDGTAQVQLNLPPANDSSKLLCLGVLLVEILQGEPIESLRQPEDLGPNNQINQFSNFQAIKRWLVNEENSGNISLSCCDAIQYCLECFAKPKARLSDEEFARTVMEKVLVPLAVERNSLFGEQYVLAKA